MKKITVLFFIAIMIAGAAFAQPIREQRREAVPQAERQREIDPQRHRPDVRPQPPRENHRLPEAERRREAALITVNGTLKLEQGIVAIQSEGETYLVPMLNRFIGFISVLREGADISVEGYQIRNIINPTKATIDGQSYDFKRLAQNNMNFNNFHRDSPRMNRENFWQRQDNQNCKDKHKHNRRQ